MVSLRGSSNWILLYFFSQESLPFPSLLLLAFFSDGADVEPRVPHPTRRMRETVMVEELIALQETESANIDPGTSLGCFNLDRPFHN